MDQSTSIRGAAGAAPESPFERTEQAYLLLNNGSNKHSLWPQTSPIPAGWSISHGPATREECLKEAK